MACLVRRLARPRYPARAPAPFPPWAHRPMKPVRARWPSRPVVYFSRGVRVRAGATGAAPSTRSAVTGALFLEERPPAGGPCRYAQAASIAQMKPWSTRWEFIARPKAVTTCCLRFSPSRRPGCDSAPYVQSRRAAPSRAIACVPPSTSQEGCITAAVRRSVLLSARRRAALEERPPGYRRQPARVRCRYAQAATQSRWRALTSQA